MKSLGVITSNRIGSDFIPHKVQNLVVKDYIERKSLGDFALSITILKDIDFNYYESEISNSTSSDVIFYSCRIFSKLNTCKSFFLELLAKGKVIHFAVEEIQVKSTEHLDELLLKEKIENSCNNDLYLAHEGLVSIFTNNHTSTKRNYIERMINDKVTCMEEALKFSKNYWDGDRKYGYGGYRYDGRWEIVAKALIDKYDLNINSNILDLGCGKGYLLYELKKLLNCRVVGVDVSQYAVLNSHKEIRDDLIVSDAEYIKTFHNKEFDLCISNMTLHNFDILKLSMILPEISRVSTQSLVTVESYRNSRELFNLQCWALTCKSFHSPREWRFIFKKFGYKGDFEFLFFE